MFLLTFSSRAQYDRHEWKNSKNQLKILNVPFQVLDWGIPTMVVLPQYRQQTQMIADICQKELHFSFQIQTNQTKEVSSIYLNDTIENAQIKRFTRFEWSKNLMKIQKLNGYSTDCGRLW